LPLGMGLGPAKDECAQLSDEDASPLKEAVRCRRAEFDPQIVRQLQIQADERPCVLKTIRVVPKIMQLIRVELVHFDQRLATSEIVCKRAPWNKGKIVGAKPPLRPKRVWSIRTKLQVEGRIRDLALFNIAIDSKLRGCDVVVLKVEVIAPSGYAADRASVRQKKAGRPIKFELTEATRQAIDSIHQPKRTRLELGHSAVRPAAV
jgi:hypothetical protein